MKKTVNIIWGILLAVIFLYGVFLRYNVWNAQLSLFCDEFVPVVKMNLEGILTQYFYHIPVGLAVLFKYFCKYFGTSELALRFLPFLFSIITLPCFYIFSKKIIKNPILHLICCFIFTVSEPLIEKAAEFKQYSSDVLISVLAVWAASLIDFEKIDKKGLILLLLLPWTLFLFSYTYVFLFIGIMLGMSILHLKNKDTLWKIIFIGVVNMVMMGAVYLIFYSKFPVDFLACSFLSPEGQIRLYPSSLNDFCKILLYLFPMFNYWDFKTNINCIYAIPFFMIIGAGLLLKKQRKEFYIITLPIVITYLAAVAGKYPFEERLVLFLIPFILILIFYPCDYAVNNYRINDKYEFFNLAIIIAYLFVAVNLSFSQSIELIQNKKDHYQTSAAKELYAIIKDKKFQENEMIYTPGRNDAVYYYYILDGLKYRKDIYDRIIGLNHCYNELTPPTIVPFKPNLIIHMYIKDGMKFYECSVDERKYIEKNYTILEKKEFSDREVYLKIKT